MSASPQRSRPGELRVPGDKSSTQRALLLGAFARGPTIVTGALRAGDTLSTVTAITALGARVTWKRGSDGRHTATVEGLPDPEQPTVPDRPLNCRNAGTLARLLTGLLAGRHGAFTLRGDASLSLRPMGRLTRPLASLGARFVPASAATDSAHLPFTTLGPAGGRRLSGGEITVDVPSAQVKSALLLAGLSCAESLVVHQAVPTRDHTERLLPRFGAHVEVQPGRVAIRPGELRGTALDLPGDPSSAAFLLVAALLSPGSAVRLRDVGVWPRRIGALRALLAAGVELDLVSHESEGEDPRADVVLRSPTDERHPLAPLEVAPADVPDLVDEIPILALAAARASGRSRFAGLAELRLKESDRVAGCAALLDALGVPVSVTADELLVDGVASFRQPAEWPDLSDHRLALCAQVAAFVSGWPAPAGAEKSGTVSFPAFPRALAALAAEAGESAAEE